MKTYEILNDSGDVIYTYEAEKPLTVREKEVWEPKFWDLVKHRNSKVLGRVIGIDKNSKIICAISAPGEPSVNLDCWNRNDIELVRCSNVRGWAAVRGAKFL